MKRDLYQALKKWKAAKDRKPLIIRGARQVGKTHLLNAFATTEYKSHVIINFEDDKPVAALFETDLDPHRIIDHIGLLKRTAITPGKTLLIFDEIQACPLALNSLKYFNEKLPELHVASAGSLLGVKLGQLRGFPVGQIDFLDLHPLSFFEFLSASGRATLRDRLETLTLQNPLPEPLHIECMTLFKQYYLIGGMPAVVSKFLDTGDFEQTRTIQQSLLKGYQSDFAKYADRTDAIKILNIWESIPSQLAKENTKFLFKVIKEGARAREYESALMWLTDAGLIYKVENTETARIPLAAYRDRSNFKLYFMDIGLLCAFCNIAPASLLSDEILGTFSGALTENLVLQELVAHGKQDLVYWTSPGKAEVDFILQYNGTLYPLEVKTGTSKKTRSLSVYATHYTGPLFRASAMNLKRDGDITNYPLYLTGRFPEIH